MVNLAGQVLKSYEIKERIGEGGFGAVFRAVQPSIGREVAVKIILPEHANKPDFIKRFESEAQLVARLEHPHIVPLYDYWREPGGAYLVMRFLKGGSLRDSLQENGEWAVGQVAQMLTQIASALSFAHASGVIHRDIKTDNILLDEAGNSYLTDFGIAKNLEIHEDITKDAILGTPAYLSPEQIRGETASLKSDIYSLGILLFEALTGSKPFYDATPATVLFKQLNEPLPGLADFRQDLPDEIISGLNAVLQRATSKDADMRYESALGLARDFTSIVNENRPALPAGQNATLDVLSITQEEEQLVQAINPYKGLRAFQSIDADDFFGRDALTKELLEHLSTTGKGHDFLAVIGPSGSGKSSVVKAGMLPRIQSGILDEEVVWYTAEMVPGTHPMEELEVALLAVATREMPDLFEVLTRDERGMVRAVKRIIPENSEFVLVIDQFEETFTLVEDEDERIHFLHSILNAVEDERSRIKIIVTLRADFYDRPLLYADFGNLIRKNTELVLPFTQQEIEASITGPAERVRVSLEPGLVAAMVTDVYERPGALPLLQYALTELFERRSGRLMTLDAYRDIGGTTGALARRAEELYESFNEGEQAATRQMFMRLVTPGEGAEDTRRRAFQSELLSLKRDSGAMPAVIEQFGKYRLLTFDHDPQTRSSTVEVAHEALIRQWQRVRNWLDENREALRLHRRLTSASEEWNQARRDNSFLARGVRLQQFEEMAQENTIALNEAEKIFLQMSIDAREERERLELERQRREHELEERARQRLTLLAGVMAIAAIIGIGLAIFAFSAQQRAEEQAVIAENNAATATIAQGQAVISADEAATSAADALEQAVIAENNAATATIAQGQAVISANEAATSAARAIQNEEVARENASEAQALALAANARNAISAGDPQLSLVLALQSEQAFSPAPVEVLRTLSNVSYAPGPRVRLHNHTGSVTGVAFSDDSRLLVTASVDGTVRVTDVNSKEELAVMQIERGWFYDVDIHPDASSVAAAASDGKVYVWSYPSAELLFELDAHTDEVLTVAYSPSGDMIASGSVDHSILIWDSINGSLINTITGHTGVVTNVVFSPDGSLIASSSADETLADDSEDIADRTIRIWDVQSGEQLELIDPASGFVRALDFSPRGDSVAYGVWDSSSSGTVRVHNVDTGREIQRFPAHTTPVTAVAYNADGSHIASVAWDRTVRIWNLDLGIEEDSFVGFGDRVLAMNYSPDGQSLALGIGNIGNNIYSGEDSAVDTSAWLWDIQNREQINAFTGHPDWIWTVDISPDGQLAVSGGGPLRPGLVDTDDPVAMRSLLDSTTVLVWDIDSLEIVAELPAHTGTVDSVRFHPDGQRVLTSAWDSQIILWDITTQEQIRSYDGHDGAVYMLRFTEDGSRFVSVGHDGLAILWDTESGEIIRTFDHAVRVNGIDFSRDERRMATASGNFGVTGGNRVWLWDLETGEVIRTFEGHGHIVNEVRFHPSGLYLISSSWDGTIRVWNPVTGQEVRQFTGHGSETFGIDFSDDGRVLLTTSSDRTVRMWDWTSGEEMQVFGAHNDWVQEVIFAPGESFAISAGQDPAARIWRINRDALSLVTFAEENRYIRDLSCDEREVYRLAPGDCE